MSVGQKVVSFRNKCKIPPKGRRFTGVAEDAIGARNAIGLKLFHHAI
jgi:hypothetical protein